jgi:SAM-dependent methyltransferase
MHITANAGRSNLKKWIKGIPVIGVAAGKIAGLSVFADARRRAFPGSASFWESRYGAGGTSGSGSYGRLAEFKAEILNDFVRTNHVRTVVELGCGDGAQLALAQYPEYVGIDVATAPIQQCSARFAHDPTKRFYVADTVPSALGTFDLALSLDVVYHLVEDPVFNSYMRALFDHARRHVIIYSSNRGGPSEWHHVRHRNFTVWITENMPDWRQTGFVPNRFPFDARRPNDTSFADFYFFAR